MGLYDSIERSNISYPEKSAIRKWYEKTMGGSVLGRTRQHVSAGANSIRAGGESVVIGALLGAASCYMPHGLDVDVTPKQAKSTMIPVDAVLAIGGLVGGTMLAHEEFGKDLANAGAAAAAIFSYRKSQEFLALKGAAKGQYPGYMNTPNQYKLAAPAQPGARMSLTSMAGESDVGFEDGSAFGAEGAEDPIVLSGRRL